MSIKISRSHKKKSPKGKAKFASGDPGMDKQDVTPRVKQRMTVWPQTDNAENKNI